MEGSDDIFVHKFSISMGGKTLFKDAKLSLAHGRRYGLIGPNGCGKSTLMHAIGYGKNEDIKNGTPQNIDILLVEQEVAASDEITAVQMVVAADTKRAALLEEAKEIELKLEEGGLKYCPVGKLDAVVEGNFAVGAEVIYFRSEMARREGIGVKGTVKEDKDVHGDYTIQLPFDEDGEIAGRLSDVYEELTDIGADSAEARAGAILSGLQFLEEQKNWPTSAFSGGWRMRISLARALFRKPRLLLLDEPTNHLDLHAVIWLEGYLQKWKHTLVVVSHDRDFLTTVCTDILHCWQKKLMPYQGAYDVFEKVFASKVDEYNTAYEAQQKRMNALKKEGKVTKALNAKDGAASDKQKKQLAAVLGKNDKGKEVKAFAGVGSDDEEEGMLERIKGLNMNITFQVAGEIPMPILAVDAVSFAYKGKPLEDGTPGKMGPTLFTDVDFGLNMDSRVALVGANGTGKSTLLKLMLQDLEPVQGEVRQSRMCKVGVYNQHSCDQLAKDVRLAKGEKLTPVSFLMHTFPEIKYQDVRNALGRFGLEGQHHEQDIHTLSGGQKSRVVFVELGLKRTHLLLLDEPTNHLDLETVDALVTALKEFKGGVMVITHNVSLINAVCNQIWIIDNCKVNPFPGSFLEYRDLLAEEMKKIYDEDPEKAKEERDRKNAKLLEREDAASAADPTKPKSKAQRDRERAEIKKAKKAKEDAEEAAKKEAAGAAGKAAAAEAAEVKRAAAADADAYLKRQSRLAQMGNVASQLPLATAMQQLLAPASPTKACAGLLALSQTTPPPQLIAPLLAAILSPEAPLPAEEAPPVEPAPVALAASESEAGGRVAAWRVPIAWLICQADDRGAARQEVLRALVELCAQKPDVLQQAAPLLRAFWLAALLSTAEVVAWAEAPLPSDDAASATQRVRRYAAPFVQWLQSAPVEELAPAA